MAEEKARTLILGATGGIGACLARRLKAAGNELILCARGEERLRSLAAELGSEYRVLDARDFGAVEAAFEGEPVRGAVCCVGSILLKPVSATSEAEFDEVLSVNLKTAFSLVRGAAKAMRRGGGSIVLVSSCAASVGLARHEAISAAKAGIEGLGRSAAASLAKQGVRVNVVAPGLTETPLSQRIIASPAALEASRAMHPLGRIGQPDDIAGAIAWLLSAEASWVTGQVLGVDGGLARVRA